MVATLYPTLIIGLEEFGEGLLAHLREHIGGHQPPFAAGVRCVRVGLCPPSRPVEAESLPGEAPLPAFYWFESEAALEEGMGLLEPSSASPPEEDPLAGKRAECQRFLQEQVNALLSIEAEVALGEIGIDVLSLGSRKDVNIVVLADLADERAWTQLRGASGAELLDILRLTSELEYAREGSVYLHVGAALDELGDRERCAEQQGRLAALGERAPFSPRFAAVRCYPFSNRLDDGTTVQPADRALLMAFLFFLHILPQSGGTPPLEELIHPAYLPAKAPVFTAMGGAFDHVPVGEVRRRLAYRLGHALLQESVCAREVADAAGARRQIGSLALWASLRQTSLLNRFVREVPVSLEESEAGEEGLGVPPRLSIAKEELHQRIAEAPADQWVELVDNFDYLLRVARLPRWKDRIERNRRDVMESMLGGAGGTPGTLAGAVDALMGDHPQPLCAAELLLDGIEEAIDEEKHPLKTMGLADVGAAASSAREALVRAVAQFPVARSLVLRALLLYAVLAGVAFAGLASPLQAAGAALALALGVGMGAFLYYNGCQRVLLATLDRYIAAVETKHARMLLAHLQAQLIVFDQAGRDRVQEERDRVKALRAEFIELDGHYETEQDRFTPASGCFLSSVVKPDHLPELYDESGFSRHHGGLVGELLRGELLAGWRAPDPKALRRTLWDFCAGKLAHLARHWELGRFVKTAETSEHLQKKHVIARLPMRHRLGEDAAPPVYLVGPPESTWQDAIRAAGAGLGTDRLSTGVPQALGVIRIQDGIEPEVSGDEG